MTTPAPPRVALAAVALTLLFAALTGPLWLGQALPVWDAFDIGGPAFAYLSDRLREGGFPLWDPYTWAGQPFAADPQMLVLGPPALLLAKAGLQRGFVYLWLANWLFGALGMLWLARRQGASAAGAFVAAVSYAFSGFFLGHAEHITLVMLGAWLPWVVGLADGAVRGRDRSLALLCAAALGAGTLCGAYPLLVPFTGLALALWLGLRLSSEEPAGRPLFLRWSAGVLALCAVVLALAFLPAAHAFLTEAASVTDRAAMVSTEASVYGSPFGPKAWLTLFFPYATLLFPESGIDLGADYSMTDGYLGFATLPLAAVFCLSGDPAARRRKRWLWLFALLMFLLSLGGAGGLRWVLHFVFPLLHPLRFNAPFRLFWALPLCLAAGLGLTLVTGTAAERERLSGPATAQPAPARLLFFRAALVWGAAACCAFAAAATLLGFAFGDPLAHGGRLLLPAAFAGPLCIALARRCSLSGSDGLPALAFLLCAACALDLGGHLAVSRATVFAWDPGGKIAGQIEQRRVRTTKLAGPPPARLRESETGAFNAHLLFKIPLAQGYSELGSAEFGALVRSRFGEVLTAKERFWLVPAAEPQPARKEALAVLAQTGSGDPVPAFIEGLPAGQTNRGPAARVRPGAYGAVTVDSYAPEQIRLSVDVPAGGGVLLSTERLTPGWRAWVAAPEEPCSERDERTALCRVQPLRANLFFRAVRLPPGKNRVVFDYRLPLFFSLAALGWGAVLAAAGAGLWLRTKGRRALSTGRGAGAEAG